MEQKRANPFVDVYQHMTMRERLVIQIGAGLYGGVVGLAMGGAMVGPAMVFLSFHGSAWAGYGVPIAVLAAIAVVTIVSGYWHWQKRFYASRSWAQSQGYTVRDFRRSDAIGAALWSVGFRGPRGT